MRVLRSVGLLDLFRASLSLAIAFITVAAAAGSTIENDAAEAPLIHAEDVYRFYALYDAANGEPSAETLQREYLDAGSPGLRHFAKLRNTTGARIAEAIDKKSAIYTGARRCVEVLPNVRRRLADALRNLSKRYPAANLPPVTIAIGRGKPVGIGYPDSGVQIGLEALCAVEFLNADVEDRFVHVIAHEYVHVQQPSDFTNADSPTVLEISLHEGAAEFVGELISGGVAYAYFEQMTAGKEREIETAFARDMHRTDLSGWLYNGTLEEPGDLGYWVGYRIVKAYYRQAEDKREALRDILEMKDAKAFLAASAWQPGMLFADR